MQRPRRVQKLAAAAPIITKPPCGQTPPPRRVQLPPTLSKLSLQPFTRRVQLPPRTLALKSPPQPRRVQLPPTLPKLLLESNVHQMDWTLIVFALATKSARWASVGSTAGDCKLVAGADLPAPHSHPSPQTTPMSTVVCICSQ